MENNFKIYSLSSSEKPDVVRYIGMTQRPLNERLRQHKSSSKKEKNHKAYWIKKTITLGFEIIISIIENEVPESIVDQKERFYIKLYRQLCNDLGIVFTNSESGGCKQKTLSEETKQKLRLINLGKKLSEETKQKIAIKSRGQVHSEESKKKMSEKMKGKYLGRKPSLESKIKMSKSQTGRKHSKETIVKMQKAKIKSIIQYDKQLNVVEEFESMLQASEKTGLRVSKICQCCKKQRKSTGGFLFSYKWEIPNLYVKNGNNKPTKKVKQFTKSKIFIREFNSISEAEKSLNISNITSCCKGKLQTAGGFFWMYS